MYYIKESEWKELEKNHPDYCGRSIRNKNIRTIFEAMIPGNNGKGGTTLLFEHKHFLIVPDAEFSSREVDDNVLATRVVWQYACSGELENLKAYYQRGGMVNRRYEAFGKSHSLIAGAYRNNEMETVKYLLSVGETILEHEVAEIQGYINQVRRAQNVENLLNILHHFLATEDWREQTGKEQARAIFTTLCVAGNIEADTIQAHEILQYVYDRTAPGYMTKYDEFENFMYGLIV